MVVYCILTIDLGYFQDMFCNKEVFAVGFDGDKLCPELFTCFVRHIPI